MGGFSHAKLWLLGVGSWDGVARRGIAESNREPDARDHETLPLHQWLAGIAIEIAIYYVCYK